MDANSAFSNCRRYSLYIASPHVAYRKHSGQTGLQHFGRAITRPPQVPTNGASQVQVAPRQDKPFLIEGDPALQPLRSRRSARHDEQMADCVLRLAASRPIPPSHVFEMFFATDSDDFAVEMELHLCVLLEALNEISRHRAGESTGASQHMYPAR
jgi:hypothetical protein